jgi:Fur family zinc uptake transcriptional regulator
MSEDDLSERHDHHGCAHALARAAHGPDQLKAAEMLCRSRGLRLTALRRDVLEALFETHRPLGAYDLVDILGRKSGKRVAAVSIYRALDFLLEQGFIHRLATRNAFIACPHAHQPGEVVVFLICETCGGVDESAAPPIAAALANVAKGAHFTPTAQVVEMAGLCDHCRPDTGGHAPVMRRADPAP